MIIITIDKIEMGEDIWFETLILRQSNSAKSRLFCRPVEKKSDPYRIPLVRRSLILIFKKNQSKFLNLNRPKKRISSPFLNGVMMKILSLFTIKEKWGWSIKSSLKSGHELKLQLIRSL